MNEQEESSEQELGYRVTFEIPPEKKIPLSHWVPVYGLYRDFDSKENEHSYLGLNNNPSALSRFQRSLKVPYLFYQLASTAVATIGALKGLEIIVKNILQ